MTFNRYEYRLHQIQILLHAYKEQEDTYEDEIKELIVERDNILEDMKYKE